MTWLSDQKPPGSDQTIRLCLSRVQTVSYCLRKVEKYPYSLQYLIRLFPILSSLKVQGPKSLPPRHTLDTSRGCYENGD